MLYISFVWRKKCKNNNSPILEGGFFGCEQLPGNQHRLQEITHLNEETIWHMRCCKTLNCWFSSLIFSFFHGLFQSHISCLWWVSSDLPRGHAAQRFCWCMTCFVFFAYIYLSVFFVYRFLFHVRKLSQHRRKHIEGRCVNSSCSTLPF